MQLHPVYRWEGNSQAYWPVPSIRFGFTERFTAVMADARPLPVISALTKEIFKNPRPAKTDSGYVSFRQSRYRYASTITVTCPDTYLEVRILTAAKKRGAVGKVERVEVYEGFGGEGSGGGKGEER